jgi:hypothetical protein
LENKKSVQSIGAMNKMKDAKDILASLSDLVRKNSVGLRIEATTTAASPTEERPTKEANVTPASAKPAPSSGTKPAPPTTKATPAATKAAPTKAAPKPAPSATKQIPLQGDGTTPTPPLAPEPSVQHATKTTRSQDAVKEKRYFQKEDQSVLAKIPAELMQTPKASTSAQPKSVPKKLTSQSLEDALMKLVKKKPLELRHLMRHLNSMSENLARTYLRDRLKQEVKLNPGFLATMDTKAKRLAYLRVLDTALSKTADCSNKDKPESSLEAPTKPSLSDGAPKDLQASRLSSENDKKRKRSISLSKKEGYVGQRVAKYFADGSGGNELYSGRVAAYFPSEEVASGVELWQIRFDDGDEEDVEEAELYVILDLYKRNRMLFLQSKG